jgi:hypothetical protein
MYQRRRGRPLKDMNSETPLEKRVSEALASAEGGDAMARAFRTILRGLRLPLESAPEAVVARAIALGVDLPKPVSWLAVLTGSQFRAVGVRSTASLEQHQFAVEGKSLRVVVEGDLVRGQFEPGWEVLCGAEVVDLDGSGRFEIVERSRQLTFTSDAATFTVELPDAP